MLGCGLIGQSWSALMVHHGHDVVAWDPDVTLLDQLPELVTKLGAQLAQLSPAKNDPGRLVLASTQAEAVSQAWLIQENAPEKKKK